MPTVSVVTDDSPHLDDVKSLWRRNSQTLGFYPSGAFEERARKRQIIGAFEGDSLVGYILYYTTKSPSVRVTHLCVSEGSRGSGVARALLSELQSATKSCRGIGLYCRRDFPAWNMWPCLGFHAVNEKIGHSKDGHELTFFWLSHPHKTLFSVCEEADDDTVTLVLDANVFYDLIDTQRMEADESLGLAADWLQPAVRLHVTPELFNEIQRNPDPAQRSARMASARCYDSVSADYEEFERAVASVEFICGKPCNERDKADQRQLAWSIAAGCDVFVTRDQRLLGHSDAFYSRHGVTVERPAEVISRFEEIRNEHEYQRDRLIGTDLRHCRQSSSGNALADAFHAGSGNEKKGELARTLNRAFANPDRFSCRVIYSPDERPLCLYLIEKAEPRTCDIRLFRLARREHNTRLGRSIIRTVLATIVRESAEQGNVLVRVSDPLLAPAAQPALRERRFFPMDNAWVKLSVSEVIPASLVERRLSELAAGCGNGKRRLEEIMDIFARRLEEGDVESVLELENLIWPGKISGTNVPSFIVPIRPDWASDLFDGRLAKERLWAAETDLVLNPDSVYYRAAKPKVLDGRGRVLWYVSEGGAPGAKMLRACSQLTGVEIGRPKELFQRHRRFGVYDWKNVLETAKSIDGELMALEFTNTELFRSPIAWEGLQEVLQRHGKLNYTFPSPVKIDEVLFFDLYKTASLLK